MTAEARQSPEQPLPENLRVWEAECRYKYYLLPVDRSKIDFIIGRGGTAAAIFDSANGIIKPLVRDPLVSKPSRLYDTNRLLILREISDIRVENRTKRADRSDKEVIEELKRRLSGTRLEPLLSWQSPESLEDIPFTKFNHNALLRNLDIGQHELSQIAKRVEAWPSGIGIRRGDLLKKIKIKFAKEPFDHSEPVLDALIFLIGAKSGIPVSYTSSKVGDLQDIVNWCLEEMERNGSNLADIIDRYEDYKPWFTSSQQSESQGG